MLCPHCKNELMLPNNTLLNMESYMGNVISVTECCGRGVRLQPKLAFDVEIDRFKAFDDWGRKIKR